MKTFLIIVLTGIWTLNLHAQSSIPKRTVYSANLDFFVGTWRYENPQTGEEFILRLRKTSDHGSHTVNARELVVGTYTYKKNGQIITDCMDKFDSDIHILMMPIRATNSTPNPATLDSNRLRMSVRDYGKRAPNGDVKSSHDNNELLIVSTSSPNQIRWTLREDRGQRFYIFLEEGEEEPLSPVPSVGFSIPTDMILTRVQPTNPPGGGGWGNETQERGNFGEEPWNWLPPIEQR